ncbi:hypothetical protein IWX47DRAFT_861907 [Phyllosticta citricarpa]
MAPTFGKRFIANRQPPTANRQPSNVLVVLVSLLAPCIFPFHASRRRFGRLLSPLCTSIISPNPHLRGFGRRQGQPGTQRCSNASARYEQRRASPWTCSLFDGSSSGDDDDVTAPGKQKREGSIVIVACKRYAPAGSPTGQAQPSPAQPSPTTGVDTTLNRTSLPSPAL